MKNIYQHVNYCFGIGDIIKARAPSPGVYVVVVKVENKKISIMVYCRVGRFSVRSITVNILGFSGYVVSVSNYSSCYCEGSHGQYITTWT